MPYVDTVSIDTFSIDTVYNYVGLLGYCLNRDRYWEVKKVHSFGQFIYASIVETLILAFSATALPLLENTLKDAEDIEAMKKAKTDD